MFARTLALGFLSAAAVAAQAGTPSQDIPSVDVHYSDLDLSTEYGATTLYHRIEGAARHVCPKADQRNLKAWKAAQDCISTAIARAVAAVDNPQLARVDAKRNHRMTAT